jgi:hypothetical protein
MNHRMTLAFAAIVAAAALATAAFAVPQLVMAGGHHYKHHNNDNEVKVKQETNQLNNCALARCENIGINNATIHH